MTDVDKVTFQRIDLQNKKIETVEENFYEMELATFSAVDYSKHLGVAVELK